MIGAKDANDDLIGQSMIDHAFGAPQLVNIERAYEIMDRYELAGLVASSPANIYYLSSHSGIMQWMGRHFSTYAFLPRHEAASPALIVPGTMLYHFDYRPTWIEKIKPVSSPLFDQDGIQVLRADGDPEAVQKIGIWPQRAGAELARGDRIQLELFARFEGKTVASALQGLKDAIVEAGAASGRIGFEDPRIGGWLSEIGLSNVKPIDACNVFREIRLVKTKPEIEILRLAAQKNEAALDYAIGRIADGRPLTEIEMDHATKWAELGGTAKWVIANVNGVNSGCAHEGDWMKLDSVGTYRGYCGDVGRTVVIGPPTDELAARIEANTKVSRILYDYIRPGMTYVHISEKFSEMMKDEGIDFALAGPHDVGLNHTDHPIDVGIPDVPGSRAYKDFVFHENTVFTLDMPHNEIGWGTTHVEDMLVVRADGCELLSSGDTSLRVV